jgi:hypothetical protein
MNLLAASDAYASGLGIINGLTKEQIVLRPLKDAEVHSLVVISNNTHQMQLVNSSEFHGHWCRN